MIDFAGAASVIVVAAAVVAVTVRDGRIVAVALLAALAFAPFASNPPPGGLAVAARIAGALLGAYMVWIAAGSGVRSEGSAIGLPAEMGIASVAFALGWWIAPVNPMPGPVAEQAGGISLLAVAALPLLGRNVFRIGIGAAVLTLGVTILMEAWLSPLPPLAELAGTALLAAILGATALLADPADPATAVVPARAKARPEGSEMDETAGQRRPTVFELLATREDRPAAGAARAGSEGEAPEAESLGATESALAESALAESAPAEAGAGEAAPGEAAPGEAAEAAGPSPEAPVAEPTEAPPAAKTFFGPGRPPAISSGSGRPEGPMATRPGAEPEQLEPRRGSLRLPGLRRNPRAGGQPGGLRGAGSGAASGDPSRTGEEPPSTDEAAGPGPGAGAIRRRRNPRTGRPLR
jgi:hypothetical protein